MKTTALPLDASAPSPSPPVDLDRLAAMSIAELETLYRRGSLPDSLHRLDGAPEGRMLTLLGLLGQEAWRARIAQFAAWRRFPWAGKSFQADSDATGSGINRIRGVGSFFPFDTRIEPSAIDGQPCILLDYDKPENPFFIRAIRDELREVAQGLFIGPAMLKRSSGPKLVLFFAIRTCTGDHDQTVSIA